MAVIKTDDASFPMAEPKFYAMVPRLIILEPGLSVVEKVLMIYYIDVCGFDRNWACWEGVTALAQKLHVNKSQISRARRKLAEKGYITLEYIKLDPPASRWLYQVKVNDLWPANNISYMPHSYASGFWDPEDTENGYGPREILNFSQLTKLWRVHDKIARTQDKDAI